MVCVLKELVSESDVGGQIWNDKGSGAYADCSIQSITGHNFFRVNAGICGMKCYKMKPYESYACH